MPNLTSDLAKKGRTRLKLWVTTAGGLLLIAGIILGGFYFYKRAEPKKPVPDEFGYTRQLPAQWLVKYFGTDDINHPSIGGADGDPDDDLLTNIREFYFNTNPSKPDTDGDGQLDGIEVVINSNPNGDGELFTPEFQRELTQRYIEANNLEEAREENVRAGVLGLLNPPDPDQVQLPEVNVSELNIISDSSDEAVKIYIEEVNSVATEASVSADDLQTILDNPGDQHQIALGRLYETVDKLKAVPVPSPLLNLHQLQISSFLSAARAFEMAGQVDPLKSLEEQKQTTTAIGYEMEVMNKANRLLLAESQRLSQKYPDIIR